MCIRDRIYTTSDPDSATVPSSMRQYDLARILVDELNALGLENVHVDENGIVYGLSLIHILLVFTNLAFMGIPIIQAFYGAQGVAMLSMFLLVFNFLVFTYGVMLVSGNGSINLRQLVNPGVVSALIALLFGLTGWRLPSPVESALSSIGSINTPMAMMVIGSSLAHSDIRAAFSNPQMCIRDRR